MHRRKQFEAEHAVRCVVNQPGQSLVERLDAAAFGEELLDKLAPVVFKLLLIGKEFFDQPIVWHDAIMPENYWAGRPITGRDYKHHDLRRYDQSLFELWRLSPPLSTVPSVP
ncbi:MAG: hypothetical protein ACRD5K_01565 [Candidatus Acidiferrales bacterium]